MENVKSNWKSSIRDGEYRRKESIFRRFIGDDGLDAESGRYHLYVSLACPWAHRTLIFRQLKQLQNHISVSVVHPDMHAQGWSFEHTAESQSLYGTTGDILHDRHFLSECYKATDQEYQSNITVPVLWDRTAGRIVNNESSEIIRMFNGAFNELTGNYDDYYPTALRTDIDEVNDWVYHSI
ncbi:MAG: glutathione S-transferase family protein, partial [Pseudomonadota bacterium]